MSIQLFDKHLTLLEKGLDLRTQRNGILASNLANRETPGFRAQDLVFGKELDQALHSDRPGPLKTSDPRHFSGAEHKPIKNVHGTQINSFNPDPNMNGNTVDLDKEMSKLAENQVMYQALSQMTSWKFRMLKSAITEGGR